jgi:hypothetical protein
MVCSASLVGPVAKASRGFACSLHAKWIAAQSAIACLPFHACEADRSLIVGSIRLYSVGICSGGLCPLTMLTLPWLRCKQPARMLMDEWKKDPPATQGAAAAYFTTEKWKEVRSGAGPADCPHE